jgi:hypothetical protein
MRETAKNTIREKRFALEYLEDIFNLLDGREHDVRYEYRKTGVDETKQRTAWRTGELLWEDEEKTIPSYEPIYEDVLKTDEEMTEDDNLKLKVINNIKATLEKMI